MQWVCRTLLHSRWHSQARREDGGSSPRRPDVFMGEKDVRARRLPGKCWHQLEKHRRKYWSAPHLHNNSLRCVETHRTNVSSELKSKRLHWHLILTYAVFNETDSSQYTRHFWSRLVRTCGRSKGGYCINALHTSVGLTLKWHFFFAIFTRSVFSFYVPQGVFEYI